MHDSSRTNTGCTSPYYLPKVRHFANPNSFLQVDVKCYRHVRRGRTCRINSAIDIPWSGRCTDLEREITPRLFVEDEASHSNSERFKVIRRCTKLPSASRSPPLGNHIGIGDVLPLIIDELWMYSASCRLVGWPIHGLKAAPTHGIFVQDEGWRFAEALLQIDFAKSEGGDQDRSDTRFVQDESAGSTLAQHPFVQDEMWLLVDG